MVNICNIDSLHRLHFTSFVTIAKMVSTSTMIPTMVSVIAVVGVTLVYISSRLKNCSMRLKILMIPSWFVLAPLAACQWES